MLSTIRSFEACPVAAFVAAVGRRAPEHRTVRGSSNSGCRFRSNPASPIALLDQALTRRAWSSFYYVCAQPRLPPAVPSTSLQKSFLAAFFSFQVSTGCAQSRPWRRTAPARPSTWLCHQGRWSQHGCTSPSKRTWSRLIKKVYEADPLPCRRCSRQRLLSPGIAKTQRCCEASFSAQPRAGIQNPVVLKT